MFTHLWPHLKTNRLAGEERSARERTTKIPDGNAVCTQCLCSAQHNVIWPLSKGRRYIHKTTMCGSSSFAHNYWYATRKEKKFWKNPNLPLEAMIGGRKMMRTMPDFLLRGYYSLMNWNETLELLSAGDKSLGWTFLVHTKDSGLVKASWDLSAQKGYSYSVLKYH